MLLRKDFPVASCNADHGKITCENPWAWAGLIPQKPARDDQGEGAVQIFANCLCIGEDTPHWLPLGAARSDSFAIRELVDELGNEADLGRGGHTCKIVKQVDDTLTAFGNMIDSDLSMPIDWLLVEIREDAAGSAAANGNEVSAWPGWSFRLNGNDLCAADARGAA